jgi:hypothetical protein
MATAAAGEVATEPANEAAWKVVFAGTPDPRILMERLEGLLYAAFDQAQMCINPTMLELPFPSRE